MTLDELYEKIIEKVGNLSLPAEGEPASILLNIDAKPSRQWLVNYKDGKVGVKALGPESPSPDAPDVTVSISEDTLLQVVEKKMSTSHAFLTGKVKVKGNFDLLAKLGKIWPE
ncbi:MAG: SCP2 sterol-binding domain-containing protein [Deltaproteobacteria bacterium]|jgi:putative sterol carrier protein|nr:SCP2 sterol-binding domain-containing protein [Deltaproteobacteria bacterium]